MIKPLSRPLSQLKPVYDVVVVGSGYGAGVAASRLSRAGQSVCVLERGREILPGQYPNSLATAQQDMQADTSRGKLGSPYGLYNVHVNDDMYALVGCGLGGTSLINANVALEIDPRLFNLDGLHWPDEFRTDPDALVPYAARARAMLDARPYPDTVAPLNEHFPPLNKLQALESSAKALKKPFYRPPIAVNYEDQINPFGVPQPRCTLCGDCTSGCNDGAKNTTLMNYLPDAHNHGADIFTRARVGHVARDAAGWRVDFMGLPTDDQGQPLPGAEEQAMSVRARIVVLGAGSLGSTEILLRSKERGLSLSKRLGQRFSGNGDVLAFGYNNLWQEEHPATDVTADTPVADPTYKSLYGIGRGSNTITDAQRPGPCITGIIDLRLAPRVQDGLVIEEGVIPGALATLMTPAGFFADALLGNFLQYGPAQAGVRLKQAQAEGDAVQKDPGSLSTLAYTGAASRMQTYLVMSVDEAAGQLVLKDDRLRIDWPGAGKSPVIARDNDWLRQANDAIKGHFIPNPIWCEPQGWKLVTVHPVGGCGMGNDAESGVVNHKCQVFASDKGTDVHPGLYVCDGAVLPGAVGVNPLLTIAAVAERACALLAADQGWTLDDRLPERQLLSAAAVQKAFAAPPPAPVPEPAVPKDDSVMHRLGAWLHKAEHAVLQEIHGEFAKVVQALEDGAIEVAKKLLHEVIDKFPHLLSPAFEFHETMHGFVSLQAVGPAGSRNARISTDYELATAWGEASQHAMSFALRVRTEDLHQLTTDPTHSAVLTGTVTCPALSEQPMPVRRGDFHLLPVDAEHVETWRMTYDMVLERGASLVRFHGFKVLHQSTGSSWWNDVTTLFVTVRDGEAGDGPLLAQGTLRLNLEDFMWQGSTIKVDPSHGMIADLVNHFPAARDAVEMLYMARFAGFFGGTMFQAYGGLLSNLKNVPATLPLPVLEPRCALPDGRVPETHVLPLPGGFQARLTRLQGGDLGPVILAPGFTVRAVSFAVDTVEQNLAEHLTAAGYDVWLFDYRASPDSGSPIGAHFSVDDIAREDWPAAVAKVKAVTGAPDVQVLAHCVGSMSLLMALLEGLEGVRSVIASALTLHPVTNWLSYLKVDLGAVQLLEGRTEFAQGFHIVPDQGDFEREIDVIAWNVPVPEGQQCKNPVCHRVFSIFGPSYTHAQLNAATHDAMGRMFGTIALSPFEQLSLIMAREQVVDASGADTYLTAEKARRLALPISFVTGARNQIFDPETISRTYHWLAAHNGIGLYDRFVFPDYEHMDMFIGRDAQRDVYPHLLGRLKLHPRKAAR
ncbi:alpha/beta fold hydrolase [Ideonella sp. A 288]|uniref:alpha/beta fold hydrolase n=1 Tax=Ideonella sp. A 288 TaxID=1962181 RepID=UPI000B4AFF6C|nr:alpha/beta fold hydrolase [Ideonella sp. A 288]